MRGDEFRHLSGLLNLEQLDLSQLSFVDGMQHLATLPKLETLILSSFEHVNDASLAQLKRLPHLQTLVLAGVYADSPKANPKLVVTNAGLASLKELPSLQNLFIESHGKFTLPLETLQKMLPEVRVQLGFIEQTSPGPLPAPPPPATK